MSFREVIPYLLASLVYHRPYLREMQASHPRHPLFLQYVWTSGILERVKDSVGAGCNRNPISKLFATGVPPHLVLANKIVDMQCGIEVMRYDIIARLESLPEQLKMSLLENFRVEGVVPITQTQIAQMMEDLKVSILTAIRQDNQVPLPLPSLLLLENSHRMMSRGTKSGIGNRSSIQYQKCNKKILHFLGKSNFCELLMLSDL